MSIIGDIEKASSLAADVVIQAAPVVQSVPTPAIYKFTLFLLVLICVVSVWLFYSSLVKKIEKGRLLIKQEFEKVKEGCDLKDRRLTVVETKVSDMRGNLEVTIKDMIEHKTETDFRVGNLEKIVSDRLLPKLDEISDKVSELIGRQSNSK